MDYVTITVAETVGAGHRGDYYDQAGALRDMVQNHLMQLLCLVAMELMVSFNANEIRNKKVDVLRAMRPIRTDLVSECAVRGQYGRGTLDGKTMGPYRTEADVVPHSHTETYVVLKVLIDNWRWQNVPFYLRTGKGLPRKVSEVAIHFRAMPHQSFSSWHISWLVSLLARVIDPSPRKASPWAFRPRYRGYTCCSGRDAVSLWRHLYQTLA